MKINKILTGVFLFFSLSSWGQSPFQDTLLRYYNKYPMEALKQAEKMQTKAVETNDQALLIRSLVLKTTYSLNIDPDSYPSIFQELESHLKQTKDTVAQSLLNSYIAQLYAQYYRNHRYAINGRSNLQGFIPENMEEWSENLFKEKVFSYLEASIKPDNLLKKTAVKDYQEVFLSQVNPYYYPTLYDLLCFRAIDILSDNNNRYDKTDLSGNPAILSDAQTFIQISIPQIPLDADSHILNIWQKLLKFRLQAGQVDFFILADLERLENAQQIYNQADGNSLTLKTLQEMRRKYEKLPVSIEIMAAEARLLIKKTNPESVSPSNKKNTENLAGKQQALTLCEEGIRLFPKYERINLLHQIISNLKAPDLRITFPQNIYPKENIALKISSKNIAAITIAITHIDTTVIAYSSRYNANQKFPKTEVFKQSYSLKSLLVHQDTTIQISGPQSGLYEISVEAPGMDGQITTELWVSQLFITQQNFGKQQAFRVCDWQSGKPVEDALIYIYKANDQGYHLLDSAHTNAKGQVTLKLQGNYYQVTNKTNPQGKLRYFYDLRTDFGDEYRTEIITDRKIYRPGQTVHFKGYAWIATTDTLYPEKNTEFKVDFRAANNEIIGTQTLTSNHFGTFTGSFIIPQDVMNGSFEISIDEEGTSIEVANYKRPEFEITFTEPKRSYYIGDTIRVQGKISSFSGVNLANSNINYQIKRTIMLRWFPEAEQNIQGLATTDANGNFEFSFVATSSSPAFSLHPYLYEINITATDAKGETQESQISIPVYTGESSPTLRLPQEINKNIPTSFFISLNNMAPDAAPQKIYYSISKLVPPGKPQFSDAFQDTIIEKTVLEGELMMGQNDSIVPVLNSYPSGAYLITVACGKNKSKQIFYLYSSKDKKPPIPTYNWLIKEKTLCRPGEKARILFGTSEPNSYVLYEIYTSKKLIKREFATLSNEVIPIEVLYLPEYGSSIWLIITYVKDKNFIQNIIPIKRIYDNRKLSIETKVFRDRLIPGQKEKWEFCIKNEQGLPAKAEMLTMMYDASLDKIAPYDISLNNPAYVYFDLPYRWESSNYNNQGYLSASRHSFNENRYWLPTSPFNRYYLYNGEYLTKGNSESADFAESRRPMAILGSIANTSASRMVLKEKQVTGTVTAGYGASKTANDEGMSQNVYRKNFQETAFFYPQLITNSSGCVTIQFTVPESTTKWKFVAIANTENLAVGELTKYSVTSKPLMIRPNLPRFLRNGDHAEIRATVSNLSDSLQTGEATLELFSPLDNQVIIKRHVSFSVSAGQSQTLSYNFDVPGQMDVIGCRLMATSGNFSDGEQQLLPILPDEILVTATKPFYIGEKGGHSYTLEQRSTTRKDYRLTLEVAANPIWYAVMALPPLREAKSDNTTDIVAAYYANTIAAMIARSNPQIVKAIQAWQTSQDKSQTLQSKLEQNPELKSILLSVTPWVLQAQNETERMQALSSLFDENRTSYLQEQAMDKLSELQSPDGGWCWFKGMYPSRFITMNVLSAMSKANTTGQREYTEREKRMQIAALRYLDKEIKKDFSQKTKTIGYEQILYLYVRSMFRDIPLGDALEAHKFFMAEAQKQWQNFSLYEKAVTALTFYRYGFKQDAQNVLRSLKEYSKMTAEIGMFWPLNQNGYYRNSGVQIQAAIMEAFYEIKDNSNEANLMKQWLLRQKQTQMWESVPSTVDAIHALLLTGTDWLKIQAPVTATIGQHCITTPSNSDPLGYIKTTYTHTEIKPDMLTVKIEKTTDSPTWGSLYLQYFDKLDQIQKQKGTLGVDKKLFIEQTSTDGKKELKPIDRAILKIGDKVIVRLTLSLSRDMEFLYLKDLRAACFEPTEQLSGNQWKFGTVYYQETKDANTNFFFTALRQGTYVIEYPVWINQTGVYQDGIATFESIYAPEYNAFSESTKVQVQD